MDFEANSELRLEQRNVPRVLCCVTSSILSDEMHYIHRLDALAHPTSPTLQLVPLTTIDVNIQNLATFANFLTIVFAQTPPFQFLNKTMYRCCHQAQ